jgi:large repetitive protein
VPLALGTQINDSFETGKKTDLYRFDASAGEKFFFDYQQKTGSVYGESYTQWRLIDPQGDEVFDQAFYTDASNITTSQTGTYTLLIEDDIVDYLIH